MAYYYPGISGYYKKTAIGSLIGKDMIMNYKMKIICAVFMLLAMFSADHTYAENTNKKAETSSASVQSSPSVEVVGSIPSLFFTYWQYKAILEAQQSRGVVRAPTQEELEALDRGEDFEPDAGIRNITLGGIVFRADDDWVIWLNGQRVTPDAVPEEVLDLRVFKNYIEVKWLDDYTNNIFPLRLRAHQRFNLDARIFLPG